MLKKFIIGWLLSPLMMIGLLLPSPLCFAKLASEPNYGVEPSLPAQNNQSSQSTQAEKQAAREKKILSLGQLSRKYPETFKTRGPRVKQVALTFDDVPDPRFTPQILDALAKQHVKATFFIVGSRAQKHPDLVERIVREGHALGNHSYNHPEFHQLTMPEYQEQILRTEHIIYGITGYKPTLIRPPYGDITEPQLKWAKKEGYKIVNWNVDSLDWKGIKKETVKNNILSAVNQGSIVLQHGGGGAGSNLTGTIEALPEVIQELKNKGYAFVTLPKMLKVMKSK